MKTVLIVAGIVALAAAAVLRICTRALNQIAREEDRQIRQQMADELFSCCYDDHDISGLIEED